jgi:hypothetical protein
MLSPAFTLVLIFIVSPCSNVDGRAGFDAAFDADPARLIVIEVE